MTRQSVFVFGSNLAGIHGAGAALHARRHHGAILGQGVGLQGTSYALPTKNQSIRTLPLGEIAKHVAVFLAVAQAHSELDFQVTNVGCGLAGYRPEEIAPLFRGAPDNCHFSPIFQHHIAQLEGAAT